MFLDSKFAPESKVALRLRPDDPAHLIELGGHGGPGGQSNESATHEAGESAAQEAAEKS